MTDDIPGTKAVRVRAGCDACELAGIHPSERARYARMDGKIVRAVPWEDGSFELEVTDYRHGRYFKTFVTCVFDEYGVSRSVPSFFLEDCEAI